MIVTIIYIGLLTTKSVTNNFQIIYNMLVSKASTEQIIALQVMFLLGAIIASFIYVITEQTRLLAKFNLKSKSFHRLTILFMVLYIGSLLVYKIWPWPSLWIAIWAFLPPYFTLLYSIHFLIAVTQPNSPTGINTLPKLSQKFRQIIKIYKKTAIAKQLSKLIAHIKKKINEQTY